MLKVKSQKPLPLGRGVKSVRQKLKVRLLGLVFLFCLFSCAGFTQDKIVAIVNQEAITQKDLNDFLNFMRLQLSTQYRGEELENQVQAMKLDLLNKLIEDRLILQEAKRGGVKADENRVKLRLAEIRERYKSESEFQQNLASQGLVQADIETKIKDQILMYGIIENKIKSKIMIKPGEVTEFYQRNLDEFQIPEYRQFQSLAIPNENTAKEIYNSLKEGADFAQVARQYSLNIDSLKAGKGRELKKDLEDVLFALNVGEYCQPIKVGDSYYIFKLESITPSQRQTLSQSQDNIRAFLFEQKMQEELDRWLDEIKKSAYIKILSD